MHLPVIHIVRRFGRVGGMESYVWHLAHGLAEYGMQVAVVCEEVCEAPDRRIHLLTVEASPERPRWKSMLIFRARVDKKIQEVFSGQLALIHSHERSICHQVTTFHGPPIEPPRGLGWLSGFNKRFTAWQQMEQDELLGTNVQIVLPVSSLVESQLMSRYPQLINKKLDLAWPGVHPLGIDRIVPVPTRGLDCARFLFVGREWKRKGLDIAVGIVAEFRKSNPNTTLTVFGPNQVMVPRSIRRLKWVILQGWSSSISWGDFDLLIHPARQEPFGMVVAEARRHGLAALISPEVGAGSLDFFNTKIIDLSASAEDWCQAATELVESNLRKPEIKWSWSDLVLKHVENIYPQLKAVSL